VRQVVAPIACGPHRKHYARAAQERRLAAREVEVLCEVKPKVLLRPPAKQYVEKALKFLLKLKPRLAAHVAAGVDEDDCDNTVSK